MFAEVIKIPETAVDVIPALMAAVPRPPVSKNDPKKTGAFAVTSVAALTVIEASGLEAPTGPLNMREPPHGLKSKFRESTPAVLASTL